MASDEDKLLRQLEFYMPDEYVIRKDDVGGNATNPRPKQSAAKRRAGEVQL